VRRALAPYPGTGTRQLSLGFQTQPPARGDLHIDPGLVVCNVHLSAAFDDTATAFWRLRPTPARSDDDAVEACVGEPPPPPCTPPPSRLSCRPCRLCRPCCWVAHPASVGAAGAAACREGFAAFATAYRALDAEVARDKFLDADEPTGTFEQYHTVPVRRNHRPATPLAGPTHFCVLSFSNNTITPGQVRQNRLIMYSGHLPHSAAFPAAAAARMLRGAGRRLMLQHFVPDPALQVLPRIPWRMPPTQPPRVNCRRRPGCSKSSTGSERPWWAGGGWAGDPDGVTQRHYISSMYMQTCAASTANLYIAN
jgi:hypothetical protein